MLDFYHRGLGIFVGELLIHAGQDSDNLVAHPEVMISSCHCEGPVRGNLLLGPELVLDTCLCIGQIMVHKQTNYEGNVYWIYNPQCAC